MGIKKAGAKETAPKTEETVKQETAPKAETKTAPKKAETKKETRLGSVKNVGKYKLVDSSNKKEQRVFAVGVVYENVEINGFIESQIDAGLMVEIKEPAPVEETEE